MAIGFNLEQEDAVSIWDTTLWAVCDANGVCYGVFTEATRAHRIADEIAGYVSDHKINQRIKDF